MSQASQAAYNDHPSTGRDCFCLPFGTSLPSLILSGPSSQLVKLCANGKTADVDAVLELLNANADPNWRDDLGNNALHHAAKAPGDNTSVVDILLQNGAEVNSKGWSIQTPLHCASKSNNPKVVNILLEKNAQVDARDASEWQPLHFAAAAGAKGCVECLLSAGADIHAITKKGQTPYHVAKELQNIDEESRATKQMLKKLMQKGDLGTLPESPGHYSSRHPNAPKLAGPPGGCGFWKCR